MVSRFFYRKVLSIFLVLIVLGQVFPIIHMPVYAANYTVKITSPTPLAACSAGATITIDGTTYSFPNCGGYISVSLSAGTHNIRANAPSGWGFEEWIDDVNTRVSDRYNPSTTLTVTGNGILGFVFGPIVTFYTSPSNGGTISVYYYGENPPITETYSNGQSGVIKGAASKLIANPASGYSFTGWSTSGSVSVDSPTTTPTEWTPAGPGTVTANFQQVQQPFDFSISVSPSSRTITAGQSTTYTVTVSLVSGTAQTVSLSLSGQHSSMSYNFNPSSGSPSFTSTLTVSTTSSTPAQTYTLTITGSGGGVVRQQQVTLIVNPPQQDTGILSIDTTPVKGEIFVNGQSWGIAPQSRTVNVGTYVVSFGSVSGYTAPASQTVTVYKGQTTSVTGVYTQIPQNKPPVAKLSASATTIQTGDVVTFDASMSYDPEGSTLIYFFDYGDGSNSGWVSSPRITHKYTAIGVFYAKVKVKDSQGLESDWSQPIGISVQRRWAGSYVETYYSGLGKKVAELHIASEDALSSGTASYVLIVQALATAGEKISGAVPIAGELFNILFKSIKDLVGKNPDGSYDFSALEVMAGWGWFYSGSFSKGTMCPVSISWFPIPIHFFDLETPGFYRLYFEPATTSQVIAQSIAESCMTLVSLYDPQGRLYLHVYDAQGNHLGVNYSTNSIETKIKGALYIEQDNVTIVLIPINVTQFRVVVDAQFAHNRVEPYSLGIVGFNNGLVYYQERRNATIIKGEKQECSVILTKERIKTNYASKIGIVTLPSSICKGDPLKLAFNCSDLEGINTVLINIVDSVGIWHNYTAINSDGFYTGEIDTSTFPIGYSKLYLHVLDNEGAATNQIYDLKVLGKLSLSGTTSKAEVISGEIVTITLVLKDQDEKPVAFANVSVTFADRTYRADYSSEGKYTALIDTRGFEGSYVIKANASNQMYLPTQFSLPLMIRPWWWPYLPYVVLAAIILIVVVILLAYGLKNPPPIAIDIEKLKQAKELLDQGDYAEAVKHSAEALRDKLSSSLNLSRSLTDVELVRKVSELRS
ncbi:MAG: PKD domain-containing protein, partial [Desulfurococcaceae archaeon]